MQRRDRHAEGGGGISGQHRDGVFVLRALLLHQIQLRDRGIEQRLLLCQVESRGHSAGMTVLDQLQSLLLNVNRFLHDPSFGIELAQGEVVGGEFRGQHQVDVVHVRCRGLQGSVRGFQGAPVFSEEVGFVTEQKGNFVGALGERSPHGDNFRPMSGVAVARCIRIGAGLREQSSRGNPSQRARLVQAVLRRRQRLVGLQQLLLVVVQLGVVENLPPCAFGQRVLGSGDTPRAFRLVRRWGLHLRTLILRSYHASRQQSAGGNAGRQGQPLHDGLPPWFGGAMLTCCPSSSESAGLMTTWSSTCSRRRQSPACVP